MKWQRTAPATTIATYILQDLVEDPEKCYGFVLGSEGFTAGCHFWEIGVGSEGSWAVGVARKPVKGSFTPEEGVWAVGRWKGQYKAFIRGVDLPLTLKGGPKNIRVCLNYDGGQVAFYDARTAVLLYEFSKASFSGETLHPFFAVYGDGNLYIPSFKAFTGPAGVCETRMINKEHSTSLAQKPLFWFDKKASTGSQLPKLTKLYLCSPESPSPRPVISFKKGQY